MFAVWISGTRQLICGNSSSFQISIISGINAQSTTFRVLQIIKKVSSPLKFFQFRCGKLLVYDYIYLEKGFSDCVFDSVVSVLFGWTRVKTTPSQMAPLTV
jgi:hypothetical protein